MTRNVVAVLIALICATAAKAETPPAPLFNKTITVSYASTIGGGTASVQRVVYVSSKGHVFTRSLRKGGGGSDSKDEALGNYSYSGGRIVGYTALRQGSGALQITIAFDPGFSTCNANLQFGQAPGGGYRSVAPNGKTYTSDKPPVISRLSCTISSGNPFGE